MKISKPADSFNGYKIDVTFSELKAIRDAMAKSHTGAIADEVYAGIKYYLDRLPSPGEDPDTENGTKNKPDPQRELVDDAFNLDKELPEAPTGDQVDDAGSGDQVDDHVDDNVLD